MTQINRPKVLVSNDDGVNAPGLKALVKALSAANICDVYVCAPAGERSAQSHAISLNRFLSIQRASVPGAVEAYAVDGTPADSVMLALNGPVFDLEKGETFDLVASGINRGDNCGLHVVYSGTVGAAREAACQGVPSIALSLDSHYARRLDQYSVAASISASIIQAMLRSIRAGGDAAEHLSSGSVINVNFPACPREEIKGLALTHQGSGLAYPRFLEVTEVPGPHLEEIEEHTPKQRVFRNYAGGVYRDQACGSDTAAVSQKWVSITPLSLRTDMLHRMECATKAAAGAIGAIADILKAAGAEAGLKTQGLSSL